jgi:hypothetical protein
MELSFLEQLSEIILSSSKVTQNVKKQLNELEIIAVIKELKFNCNK